MDSQSPALVSSIFSTTIWAILFLGVCGTLGIGLGWLCGQAAIVAAISRRIFQFLACGASILTFKVFGLFVIIALFTTIGVQKAKQEGNQWHYAIANTFLGIRLGLILFWAITPFRSQGVGTGLGFYIFNAHNDGNVAGVWWGALSILVLAVLFDQALNLIGKRIINRALSSARGV
jgi:hypothetical protein